MYSSAAPGPARRGGGNPPVNVAPPQIRGAPNPANMAPMANAGAASSRISDMLDQVKAEYEAAIQQLNISKMEQLEMERKIQSQVVEMDQIQQTLKTLEANHRRIRVQYEEEVLHMRRQLEGQSAAAAGQVKMSNKRLRTQGSAGGGGGGPMPEDAMMKPGGANGPPGAPSNRPGNPRSNSPVRVVPVQPASRSLQQLGQQPLPQGPQSQPSQQAPPPQLSPLEGQSTTPTNRRGPIPGLNRDAIQEANGKVEGRSIPPVGSVSQSGSTSPVIKKSKTNGSGDQNSIPSITNGKGSLPSVSAASGSSSSGSMIPSVPKIHREHHGSAESSPSSSNNSGQAATASTPTPSGASGSNKQSPQESNAGASSGSSGSNATQKTSNSKASRLNWSCVYSSKGSMSYQESERPVAEMHQSMDHQSVVCVVRFSNDGTMMASGCHKTAQVFDVKTGDRKFFVSRPGSNNGNANNATAAVAANEADDAYVRAVCFSPDCTKLVAGMPHNTIRIWDIASNEEGPAMTGHESEIYSLDYVNDFIVSGSGDRKVRLWDARSGQCKKIFGSESGGPSDGVTSVALSPDGRLLAAGSLDKVVRIWDTETAQLLDRLEGHSDSVYSIAFSPDGKNLISGSLDRNIMLWDVCAQGRTTTRPRMLFQGHKDFVLSVAYTPDGRWLMSGSKDRSVVFWDPRSSRSVLTLTGYRNSVISVASSPASPYFATGSGDCFAVVWKYQCQSF